MPYNSCRTLKTATAKLVPCLKNQKSLAYFSPTWSRATATPGHALWNSLLPVDCFFGTRNLQDMKRQDGENKWKTRNLKISSFRWVGKFIEFRPCIQASTPKLQAVVNRSLIQIVHFSLWVRSKSLNKARKENVERNRPRHDAPRVWNEDRIARQKPSSPTHGYPLYFQGVWLENLTGA